MINNIINNKIVVFDLDETLGSFTELGIFWDALESFYGDKLPNDAFITLLDMLLLFLILFSIFLIISLPITTPSE